MKTSTNITAMSFLLAGIFATGIVMAGGGPKQANGTRTHQTPTTMTDTTIHGPAMTGQPKASCEETPNTPGNSASAPGSAFNPTGTAGSQYAGEQPQNSRNTASVSQYDVACARQPQ